MGNAKERSVPEGWKDDNTEEKPEDESLPKGWKNNVKTVPGVASDFTENHKDETIPEGWKTQPNYVRFNMVKNGKSNTINCANHE